MATRLTTCHHPYHHRFSTVSADEPVRDDSGAACPACGKVSTLAYLSCNYTAACILHQCKVVLNAAGAIETRVSESVWNFFFISPQIFTRPGDQNVVEVLNKCPFADMGCTADLMSYEDLQQHLELVHIPHLYETFVLLQLQPDQTEDQTTLLHSCLQHFFAIMPSDTEASPPLSEQIRCDSGFAEDELQYIDDEGQDGITQLLQQESFGQSVSGSRDVAEQTTESLFEVETLSASRLVDSPSFRLASIESGINSGHLIWKIEP